MILALVLAITELRYGQVPLRQVRIAGEPGTLVNARQFQELQRPLVEWKDATGTSCMTIYAPMTAEVRQRLMAAGYQNGFHGAVGWVKSAGGDWCRR